MMRKRVRRHAEDRGIYNLGANIALGLGGLGYYNQPHKSTGISKSDLDKRLKKFEKHLMKKVISELKKMTDENFNILKSGIQEAIILEINKNKE